MTGLRERLGEGPGAVSRLAAAAALLIVALTFGGSSRQAPLGAMLVQLSAVPLLVMAVLELRRGGLPPGSRAVLALLAAIVLAPLLQLAPLPPGLWSALPGRALLVAGADLAGLRDRWLPLSLNPTETFRAALFLIPPAAMFLGVVTLERPARSVLVGLLVGVALISILVGVVQVGAGGTLLRLYERALPGAPQGFFANRNHQALFLVAAMLLVIGQWCGPRAFAPWLSRPFVGPLVVVILMTGAAATLSRAGLGLLAGALLGGLVLIWRLRGRRGAMSGGLALVAGSLAAGGLILWLRGRDIGARFLEDPTNEVRLKALPTLLEVGRHVQPAGGGFGSFDRLYRAAEPLESLGPLYLNNAHNDYLEIWIEGGVLAIVLLAAAAVLWLTRAFRIWRSREMDGLAGAATLVLAAFWAHAFVDYSIRTPALATVAALAWGLMFEKSRGLGGANISTRGCTGYTHGGPSAKD